MNSATFQPIEAASSSPQADLTEARRLFDAGMKLVKLHHNSKRPVGEDWNHRPATRIDPNATGYGIPLAMNGLCSIDPDHVEMARAGLAAWGFDLDQLLAAGVRTSSTRPGSGGRSAFAADEMEMMRWLTLNVFDSEGKGITVLELRAKSENLQDCVPGVLYIDKSSGELCTQQYANGRRFDDAPELPEEFARFWRYLSTDDEALRDYSQRFTQAIIDAGFKVNGQRPRHVVPMGNGKKLAFPSKHRGPYNRRHTAEPIFERHDYRYHANIDRWSHPGATGAPGIRPIPGKDGLWRSDHGGDRLHGTFDAWAAHVQLDHGGDLMAAEAAQEKEAADATLSEFDQLDDTPGLTATDDQPAPTPEAPGWQHPLARVIELGNAPRPPAYILPYFIGEGVVIIAGAHGVGKTTALLPLSMAAAGLHEHDYPLAPREWRHVVYITEDSHQVERIIAGYAPTIGATAEGIGERVHIVEAARMAPEAVVQVGGTYQQQYTRTVTTTAGNTVELPPLVVFDTKAAVFELENDNDNAEASKMIAAIKQRFANLPTWIVGHVSKMDLSRDGAKSGMPTFRGASAFEADANQVLYLVKESDGTRWLVRGKTRFEAKWEELLIETYSSKIAALNIFDEPEELTLRWAVARPQEKTRKEITAAAEEAAKAFERERKKAEMLDVISRACAMGEPLNRSQLAKEVGGNAQATKAMIQELVDSCWAVEVMVPHEIRIHHQRSRFLVSLTQGERDHYQETNELPPEKQAIPESWQKPPKPEKAKVTPDKGEENDGGSSVPGKNT